MTVLSCFQPLSLPGCPARSPHAAAMTRDLTGAPPARMRVMPRSRPPTESLTPPPMLPSRWHRLTRSSVSCYVPLRRQREQQRTADETCLCACELAFRVISPSSSSAPSSRTSTSEPFALLTPPVRSVRIRTLSAASRVSNLWDTVARPLWRQVELDGGKKGTGGDGERRCQAMRPWSQTRGELVKTL